MRREKTFTDEQDAIIEKMITAYEEGNVSGSYSKTIKKELKDANDLVEAYYVFVNNIPEKLLSDRQELVIKHEGEKQVILSEYLLPGGTDGN